MNLITCPTDAEVWLEYGYVKGSNSDHDMLWYNEGNADEFNTWFRALMTKKLTDEPSGHMYFRMRVSPHCDIEIECH